MCECGCASVPYEEAHRLKGTKTIIAFQRFHGCKDCDYGPGVSVSFFDSTKSARQWIDDLKIRTLKPDEFGSNNGRGISLGCFDPQDLRAEARELWKAAEIGTRDDQYANLDDWLSDFGSKLVQGACRRFEAREEALLAKGKREHPQPHAEPQEPKRG